MIYLYHCFGQFAYDIFWCCMCMCVFIQIYIMEFPISVGLCFSSNLENFKNDFLKYCYFSLVLQSYICYTVLYYLKDFYFYFNLFFGLFPQVCLDSFNTRC